MTNCLPLNSLARARSPYLRQHASNPVHWLEWSDDALQRARAENKPIFLSIGYAACHWCHVMAHESFEDPTIAAILNQHFISIKVDREERPDLDHIYMTATIQMTGSGGWPMSVFLLPDGSPFFAGTYFPPEPRHGLPCFRQILEGIINVWRTQPASLAQIATRVREELQRQQQLTTAATSLAPSLLDEAANALCRQHDVQHGGWGRAPKFPQPMAISFLLRRHFAGHPSALQCATHALRAMARGGMYDVVGGGFARYSTDDHWLVPHFEKMLYDNALLARAYLHAWLCTRDPFFRRVAEHTLAFVQRELAHPGGGFYSSLDADSDGKEGAFYVWSADELAALLGDEWLFFQRAYNISPAGNWEGNIILQRARDDAALATKFSCDSSAVAQRLDACHSRLLAARNDRPRPGLDDKIITSWNALVLAVFAEAARYLDSRYLPVAQANAHFLLSHLRPNNSLRHSWCNGEPAPHVFLEDFAALILALLELYQADGNLHWYRTASALADEMITRFEDPAAGFFDTPADAPALIVRPKELQDNATPSGNALAAEALILLAHFTGNSSYRARAEASLTATAGLARDYPLGFARWLCALDTFLAPEEFYAVIGPPDHPATRALIAHAHADWNPHRLIACSREPVPSDAPAWLLRRSMLNGQPAAFRCTHAACSPPITTPYSC